MAGLKGSSGICYVIIQAAGGCTADEAATYSFFCQSLCLAYVVYVMYDVYLMYDCISDIRRCVRLQIDVC